MMVLAFSVLWLGQLVSGLLFMMLFLVLAAVFVRYFTRGVSPIGWSLRAFAEPLVQPVRRLLRPLPIQFDLAPLVTAGLLYLLQWSVLLGASRLSVLLAGPFLPPVNRALLPFVSGVRFVLWGYLMIVLLRVLVTWFGSPEHHPFVRFLARWVDPVLYHIRKLVSPRLGRLDLAPLVLIAALSYVDQVVLRSLLHL